MKEMIFRTSDDGLVMNSDSEIELVRCKDCKHAVAQDCEQVWCSFVDDGLAHEPNWFCADGERKKLEGEA